jgi:hypothetical protein
VLNCHSCSTVLHETRREEHGLSIQTWYQCPLCGRQSLTSHPRLIEAMPPQLGLGLREASPPVAPLPGAFRMGPAR